MQRIGPALETLTRRLAETPPDFLDEPASDPAAATVEAALVNDLLGALGARATAAQLAHFHRSADKSQRNRLTLVRIAVWLLYDPWFMKQQLLPDVVLRLLDETVAELAASSAAASFAWHGWTTARPMKRWRKRQTACPASAAPSAAVCWRPAARPSAAPVPFAKHSSKRPPKNRLTSGRGNEPLCTST